MPKKIFKKKPINRKPKEVHASIVGLIQAAIVFIYTVLLSFFINILPGIFTGPSTVTAPALVLIIFIMSALFIILALFGYPALMVNNKKMVRALSVLGYSFVWFLVLLIIFLVAIAR